MVLVARLFKVQAHHQDARSTPAFKKKQQLSDSTLTPPRRTSAHLLQARSIILTIASVRQDHSARRPTAPLPTAMDAFAVLQLAHLRRVSFAPRLTTDARPYTCVRTMMVFTQTQLHVLVELKIAQKVSSANPPVP